MELIVILLVCIALILSALLFASEKDRDKVVRDATRERRQAELVQKDLMDRLMHLTGATWTPPPRDVSVEEEEPEPTDWRPL